MSAFTENIEKLIKKTEEGELNWTQESSMLNYTTIINASEGVEGMISIQQVDLSFIFQVKDRRNSAVKLLVDTRRIRDEQVLALLKKLYDVTTEQIIRAKFEFLDKLMKGIE